MVQAGQTPLASLRVPERSAASPAPREDAPLGTREIILYFAAADGSALAPESTVLEYTNSTVENCRRALNALIAGPRDILVRVLPPSARIRALYLRDNGELVVDFSRELQTDAARFRSATHESLLFYAVVNTVTQPALRSETDPAVSSVRFLIEGAPPTDVFPAHLDLRQPLVPDPAWIATAHDRPAHG